jgi:hypothetical protein
MSILKKTMGMGLVVATGVLGYAAPQSDAEARSSAAFIGGAANGAHASCFSEQAGGPKQNCAGERKWVIPMVYDNAGNMTVTVAAKGFDLGQVWCRAYSATQAGIVSGGNWDATVEHTEATELLTTSVFAQGWGGTWVSCDMDVGTRVLHVSY